MNEVNFWRGEFGDSYTERNTGDCFEIKHRHDLWKKILPCFYSPPGKMGKFNIDLIQPESVLEVGAGSGNNLWALRNLLPDADFAGVEPNAKARALLEEADFVAHDGTATAHLAGPAELVFTSGLLIHIPPDELSAVCQSIYDVAEKYIVCIEYFSVEPQEKMYCGFTGKLWTRDFGSFWLDHFNLKPLGCGFAWKRMTGLDDLTWWAFHKC